MTTPAFNRREWLTTTGLAFAGLALTSRTPLRAQHEVDRSAGRREPIKLSSNENPFGPAPSATMAMMQAVEKACRYPANETKELVKLIAAKEGVPEDFIVLGVGSGEVLDSTGMHFGMAKGEIICAEPGYLQLVRSAEAFGGKPVWVPLTSKLDHDLPAMASKVGPATSLVYICNPNNPTGTLLNANDLRAFCIEVSKKAPVFVDEAYLDCADDYAGNTMVDLVRKGHNVVIARTFSKIHGLAGMRVGYGVMAPKMAKVVKGYATGSLNMLGVAAAIASIQDAAFIAESGAKIKAGRDGLIKVVQELGKEYAVSQTNFLFFKTGMPLAEFSEKMKAENILIARPFPPLLDWARISIGLPEEMDACHRALRKILAKA